MSNKFLGLALVAGLALAAPGLATAQSMPRGDGSPVIVVMGRASVTKPAEWAAITGMVRAQAKDQQTALKLMSDKQDAIVSGLERLAGARGVKIDTGDIDLVQVLPDGCRAHDSTEDGASETPVVQSGGKCAPIGVQASIKITATVRPADQLGSLASLAIQLGAEQVQLGEYGVDDSPALEAAAARAAYDQALGQAKLLASAANAHIGRLVRLNRGVADEGDIRSGVLQVLAPAVMAHETPAPPLTPVVALKLTPPKVTESSWVVVEFELVR